jgi:hypothetical protein
MVQEVSRLVTMKLFFTDSEEIFKEKDCAVIMQEQW